MKLLEEKKYCSGCGACKQVCPKRCITMKEDYEGFLYPIVDPSECIKCGLCKKVCYGQVTKKNTIPLKCYTATIKDDKILLESSSGGIFSLLSTAIIETGGVVFGAVFDRDWQVKIDYRDTIEGLSSLRGSKYVQATVGEAFSKTKIFLESSRNVLFSGTPCQIAGLLSFLRHDYQNLITVEVACHGVPSPKVWDKYLDSVSNIAKQNNYDSILSIFYKNTYMRAFLDNLFLRPSCHNCKARRNSGSDLTIADFWGVNNIAPHMNNPKGVSLILANTSKGLTILKKLGLTNQNHEIIYSDIIKWNPSIVEDARPHPKREAFFEKLEYTKDIIPLIQVYLKPSIYIQAKDFFKSIFYILKKKQSIKFLSQKQFISHNSTTPPKRNHISYINFRNKTFGWENYSFEIRWEG